MKQERIKPKFNPLSAAILIYLIIFVLAVLIVSGKEIFEFLTKTF